MEQINRGLFTELEEILGEIKIDFGGGCSFEKAYVMAWLIANYQLKSTVDIGVYRGRSLFPQALVPNNSWLDKMIMKPRNKR